jgi:purine-binding chemotaxis protein CheW
MKHNHSTAALLVRVSSGVCALPLAEVIETMRPLPVSPLSGVSDFVSGVALIRGVPMPVVDLGSLLGTDGQTTSARFVTLRSGGRTIAIAVQSVIGVAELDGNLASIPPLLKSARTDAVEAIGSLDAELLLTLQAAKLVPESVWAAIGKVEAEL